jgi:hypothetical protein
MDPLELMRDGEVNRPSVEPLGLTNAREIAPHTNSQEDKAWGRSDWGGRCEGRKRALAICRVGDRREEGE